jgi:hypothetical protein
LEFQFRPTSSAYKSISFDLLFGTEEYPEYLEYADSAVIEINGQNFAKFENGNPLTVSEENKSYFRNNNSFDEPLVTRLPIEYDGISKPLTIFLPIRFGV